MERSGCRRTPRFADRNWTVEQVIEFVKRGKRKDPREVESPGTEHTEPTNRPSSACTAFLSCSDAYIPHKSRDSHSYHQDAMSGELMEVAVTPTDDEVERKRDQQQPSDDVEDDRRNLFLARFLPLVDQARLSGETGCLSFVNLASLRVRHRRFQ